MKRRWFAVLGALMLAGSAGAAGVLGVHLGAAPLLAAQVGCFTLAGGLLVVGGLGVDVGPAEWHHLVGVADVVLGGTFLLQAAGELTTGGPSPYAVVVAVGGLSVAFVGTTWLLNWESFDRTAYEPGPLLDR